MLPDRCLPIVEAQGYVGRTLCHGLQAAVGVHAGTGQRQQGGEVVENAADEVASGLAQVMGRAGIVEQVPPGLTVPEADMDVTAAADEVNEGSRGEAGQQAVLECDATHGVS